MSKSALAKVLSAAKARLVGLDESVREAEITLSSLQLRAGIVLATVSDALAQRADAPSLKEWTAKEYKGRSYGTLNRWARAGAVALVLGFSDEDEELPTVMDLEPLYRVLNTGKREQAEENVRTAWAKAEKASKKVSMPERTMAQATALVGEAKPGPKKNRTKAPADTAGTATVTVDLAAVESLSKTIAGMNKRHESKGKEGLTAALILQIRSETIRLIESNGIDTVMAALGITAKPSK